jgi:hypothetical protein
VSNQQQVRDALDEIFSAVGGIDGFKRLFRERLAANEGAEIRPLKKPRVLSEEPHAGASQVMATMRRLSQNSDQDPPADVTPLAKPQYFGKDS